MYPFFLRLFLACGLPFTKSSYLRLASETRRRQFWASDRIHEFQIDRLRKLLTHAGRHTHFYRERLGNCGIDARGFSSVDDLARIPMLTKQEIETNFPDRIVSEVGDARERRWYGTRGTTHRINVINDFWKRDCGRAAQTVSLTEDSAYKIGKRMTMIPPDACSQLCAADGMRETSVTKHLAGMLVKGKIRDQEAISDLRGLVSSNWISCLQLLEPFGPEGIYLSNERLADYVERIRRRKPAILKALPEYLLALARYLYRNDIRLRIPVVKPMGALMSPVVRREIEEGFRVPVREDYGSSDLGPMAFDCSARRGMHLFTDHYVFEVWANGRPAADSEVGLLLVTDLNNLTMPLIRYRVGDVASINRAPCPCGRLSPRITLEGRIEDTIVLSDRTVMTPRMLCDFFFRQTGIGQFQLIERASGLDLLFVSTGEGPNTAAIATEYVRRFGDDRPLRARAVRSIPPESSGKFRYVKSDSHERFGAPS